MREDEDDDSRRRTHGQRLASRDHRSQPEFDFEDEATGEADGYRVAQSVRRSPPAAVAAAAPLLSRPRRRTDRHPCHGCCGRRGTVAAIEAAAPMQEDETVAPVARGRVVDVAVAIVEPPAEDAETVPEPVAVEPLSRVETPVAAVAARSAVAQDDAPGRRDAGRMRSADHRLASVVPAAPVADSAPLQACSMPLPQRRHAPVEVEPDRSRWMPP